MKLSKSLLSAILIGITVQTITVSCGKDNLPEPKDKKETKKDQPLGSCPACGMG